MGAGADRAGDGLAAGSAEHRQGPDALLFDCQRNPGTGLVGRGGTSPVAARVVEGEGPVKVAHLGAGGNPDEVAARRSIGAHHRVGELDRESRQLRGVHDQVRAVRGRLERPPRPLCVNRRLSLRGGRHHVDELIEAYRPLGRAHGPVDTLGPADPAGHVRSLAPVGRGVRRSRATIVAMLGFPGLRAARAVAPPMAEWRPACFLSQQEPQ